MYHLMYRVSKQFIILQCLLDVLSDFGTTKLPLLVNLSTCID